MTLVSSVKPKDLYDSADYIFVPFIFAEILF